MSIYLVSDTPVTCLTAALSSHGLPEPAYGFMTSGTQLIEIGDMGGTLWHFCRRKIINYMHEGVCIFSVMHAPVSKTGLEVVEIMRDAPSHARHPEPSWGHTVVWRAVILRPPA